MLPGAARPRQPGLSHPGGGPGAARPSTVRLRTFRNHGTAAPRRARASLTAMMIQSNHHAAR
eukprot:159337-Hanusia_phi.AAC.2